jgi:hypothetical protein
MPVRSISTSHPAAICPIAGSLGLSYVDSRAMTVAGSTSAITRSTITERILGSPRDRLLK